MTTLSPDFIAAISSQVAPSIAACRAATPHVVPQWRLLRSEVGEAYDGMIEERREWIADNCVGEFMLDELRDSQGREIGRVFRFSDYYDAVFFRMRF